MLDKTLAPGIDFEKSVTAKVNTYRGTKRSHQQLVDGLFMRLSQNALEH